MTQKKKSPTVWVVHGGDYSDYRVQGVFSSKKNAEMARSFDRSRSYLRSLSMSQIRQGDVLLIPVARIPKAAKAQAPKDGLHILAHGEVTGHHHSVDAKTATLSLDEGGVMFLAVEELTEVRHQEHAPVTLAPGQYKVVRQREYSPEEIRSVAD